MQAQIPFAKAGPQTRISRDHPSIRAVQRVESQTSKSAHRKGRYPYHGRAQQHERSKRSAMKDRGQQRLLGKLLPQRLVGREDLLGHMQSV